MKHCNWEKTKRQKKHTIHKQLTWWEDRWSKKQRSESELRWQWCDWTCEDRQNVSLNWDGWFRALWKNDCLRWQIVNSGDKMMNVWMKTLQFHCSWFVEASWEPICVSHEFAVLILIEKKIDGCCIIHRAWLCGDGNIGHCQTQRWIWVVKRTCCGS